MSATIFYQRTYFGDTGGKALDGGKLYIGVANQDPETTPLQCYWDEGLTVPATQPLTITSGYVTNGGARAAVYVNAYSYSLRTRTSSGVLVDYVAATNDNSLATNIGLSSGSSLVGFLQAGTGAVARTAQDKLREFVSVKDFGAIGNGVANDTTAIQAAITYVSVLGGTVYFPAGTYKITSTLTISANGVYLKGAGNQASKLVFTGMATDGIKFQGAGQINGGGVMDMWLVGSTLTNGIMINMQVLAYGIVENVNIDDPWNGFLCYQTNTIVYRNVVINLPHGAYAGKWDSPTTNNSSALTLDNVTMQGGYLGADGFQWDGWATTLRMKSVAILSFNYGVRILNSRNSATKYPSFATVFDLEVDGAKFVALDIEAGYNFKFVDCDITNTTGASGQGSADSQAVVINPDSSYSITRFISFLGCQIGNCRQQGAYINAKNVSLTGCTTHDVSKQGAGLYAAIELGPLAQDIEITGGQAGIVYGDAINANYGVLINATATRIGITGVDVSQTTLEGIHNNNPTDPTIQIYGCPGFRSKTAGVATINAAATSVTVAHGITYGTPTSIVVSPQQSLSAGTTFYGTISGGNVIIGMSVAQAGNITFCWSASLGPSN